MSLKKRFFSFFSVNSLTSKRSIKTWSTDISRCLLFTHQTYSTLLNNRRWKIQSKLEDPLIREHSLFCCSNNKSMPGARRNKGSLQKIFIWQLQNFADNIEFKVKNMKYIQYQFLVEIYRRKNLKENLSFFFFEAFSKKVSGA